MKAVMGRYTKDGTDRFVSVRIDHDDILSVCHTLAAVIHPALRRFKEETKSYPVDLSEELWDTYLDSMIWSFNEIIKDDFDFTDPQYDKKIQNGLNLFSEYYRNLWS